MNPGDSGKKETLDSMIDELRKDYIAEWARKKSRLTSHLEDLRSRNHPADALSDIRMEFHRLCGTGTTYGYPDVSDIAMEAEKFTEDLITSNAECTNDCCDEIQKFILAIDRSFLETGPSS